ALSAVLVPWLVVRWGVAGAAYGSLAGNVVGSVGRWAGFAAVLSRREQPAVSQTASVIRVLQQFTASSDSTGWCVEQLNEGAEAGIFAVRRADGRPVWEAHDCVVVKLYKPAPPQYLEVVNGQFAASCQWQAS